MNELTVICAPKGKARPRLGRGIRAQAGHAWERKNLSTFLILSAMAMAQAQEAAPPIRTIQAGAILRTEVSRTPDTELNWNGKPARAWRNWTPGAWTLLKMDGPVSYYRNSVNDVRFDALAFTNTATTLYKEHHILEQKGQRPEGPLQSGQKWQASVRYISNPVNWCASLETKLTGDFEVQDTEPYTLKIDGQEVTLQVQPVVRRGYWQRCYQGPQTQRVIWSPQLGVLLSLELLSYDPQSRLDPYSYIMRVTSIESGKQGGHE